MNTSDDAPAPESHEGTALPPLNALRAFEAVARHGSVTGASRELHVTQSAVSHQVRNLERQLDVNLFERHGPRLLLTEPGLALYNDLNIAFARIRRGVGKLLLARDDGGIGIHVRPHFAMNWLSPRINGFTEQHPDVNLHFYHSNAAADFSQPDVHLSIEWRHRSTVGEHMTLLLGGDLTPACHPDLLQGKPLQEPADLASHTLLHETDRRAWREWLLQAGCDTLDVARETFYEDTNVRQQAAMSGAGVALVCPALIESDLQAGRLILPFAESLDSYGYYLVAPPEGETTARIRAFCDWIIGTAGSS